jgi:hypothetical protein
MFKKSIIQGFSVVSSYFVFKAIKKDKNPNNSLDEFLTLGTIFSIIAIILNSTKDD